jgi:geranylgeranyl diphosphate synthase type II
MTGEEWLGRSQVELDRALDDWLLTRPGWPEPLAAAAEYALRGPGKRFRPALTWAAGQWLGLDWTPLRPVALALEMVHTYSLVHDDLPAMDDDDWRRGRATTHKVFGEAVAILAGDALLTEAFGVLTAARRDFTADRVVAAVEVLTAAAGGSGMAGGQVLDLQQARGDADALARLHRAKTGAMITAAVVLPAVLAGRERERAILQRYGEAVGLAFQITDDILDVVGDQTVMGKAAGRDAAQGKVTYATLYGLEDARRRARDCLAEAQTALAGQDADALMALAYYVVERDR